MGSEVECVKRILFEEDYEVDIKFGRGVVSGTVSE